jgi:hypothetical protein
MERGTKPITHIQIPKYPSSCPCPRALRALGSVLQNVMTSGSVSAAVYTALAPLGPRSGQFSW